VSFARLTPGHWLALVAALCLLLALAPDWYTDKQGEQDRFYQRESIPGATDGTTSAQQLNAEAAETHEKNAWQAPAAIDRIILLTLLAAAGLAIAAAFLRAAGRDVGPPSPSALASLVGLFGCVLVTYRIFQPPGLDVAAIVKPGAPAGLVCVGLVTIGSRIALRQQRERPAPAAPDSADGEPAPASPAGAR
jgi:peptidoglycan/LPS O-acetylase OafA/YrhL